jgi:hypothetical protein
MAKRAPAEASAWMLGGELETLFCPGGTSSRNRSQAPKKAPRQAHCAGLRVDQSRFGKSGNTTRRNKGLKNTFYFGLVPVAAKRAARRASQHAPKEANTPNLTRRSIAQPRLG